MAKKLMSSYNLSEESRRALEDENVQGAARAPNASQALSALNADVPTTVSTVEGAEKVSRSLGRVNKRLREARMRRTS